MLAVHDGQCGLCSHFGDTHVQAQILISIRSSHQAPESLIDACSLPRNASLHLKVTATSGCDGFQPAAAA